MASRIKSKFRNFLWNDLDDKHMYHLVDYNSIFHPLSSGGLGLRVIRDYNKALISKWLWRFGVERESL